VPFFGQLDGGSLCQMAMLMTLFQTLALHGVDDRVLQGGQLAVPGVDQRS